MVLQLAEIYYRVPGLYRRLMTPEHDRIVSRSNFQESTRGYSFGYDLRLGPGNSKVIQLPDEINLSRRDLAEYYRQAEVYLSGKGPGGSFSLRGAPILFGITVPENCPDKAIAYEWVSLLLSDFGRVSLEKAGLVPLTPGIAGNIDKIPQPLKIRVK
jgi:molybdate/tungstate transport system substrate-binding protein